MDATRIPALLGAVDNMAEQLGHIGPGFGDVFSGFTCFEVNAIAAVLAIGGHEDTAVFVLTRHAEGDDPTDPDGQDDGGDDHGHIRYLLDTYKSPKAKEVVRAGQEYVKSLLDAAGLGH